MALRYPGVAEAAAGGIPPRFTLEELAACPRDSLGGSMHAFVVDNGFDLEVLDRDSLGLQELPPPLDYLNVRILQCHDIWHLVAGHATSGLHEVSVSGFQMAQFGVGPPHPRDPRPTRRDGVRLALPGVDPRGDAGPGAPPGLTIT